MIDSLFSKKSILIALIALIVAMASITVAQAQGETTQPLVFIWEQDSESLISLDHWTLYVRGSADGAALTTIDMPYAGGEGPEFSSEQTFTVTGAPGSVVSRFFTVTATSKNGTECGHSNQVRWDFTIPYADVKTPVSLTVTVIVAPQGE